MNTFKTVLLLIIAVSFLAIASNAQNTAQDYVNTHNTARSQVGAAIPNVVWDATVAAYAQSYANARKSDCNLVHSNGQYGENLAKGSSSTFSGQSAVNLWVNEKPYYNYTTNSCTGGQCLHYTQVVWRPSVKIGCARVQCTNNGWWFVTCNYDTPGNYIGQYPY